MFHQFLINNLADEKMIIMDDNSQLPAGKQKIAADLEIMTI